MARARKSVLGFVIAAGAAVLVAAGIFALTEQAPDATASASSTVNDLLIALFGSTPLYDSASDTWLGVGIRHWAHTAEFWLFGIFATVAVWLAVKPRLTRAAAISLAVCAAFSLFDQCHKLFVPGRHFDAFDLVMDALGYGLAILTVLVVVRLVSSVAMRHPRQPDEAHA